MYGMKLMNECTKWNQWMNGCRELLNEWMDGMNELNEWKDRMIEWMNGSGNVLYSWKMKTTKVQSLADYQVKNIAKRAKNHLIQIVSLCTL